jgi:hypothetical protein
MTKTRSRSAWTLVVIGILVACGEQLISDPSFDVWCGDALCSPWEATGQVSRVKTWHEKDFGVALGNGAVLSQRSRSKHRVDCMEFEVIADVEARADVVLEMDFLDDGTSEYAQPIPESHWAKLRFFVKTPTWYDGVRFILRKRGKGRAVLAQIKANGGDECEGEPVALAGRPLGARCEAAEQCESALCQKASVGGERAGPNHTCGECSDDVPCADGAVCGFGLNDLGGYTQCTPAGQAELGASCLTDAECASGDCAQSSIESCPACNGTDCDNAWRECVARSLAGTCR